MCSSGEQWFRASSIDSNFSAPANCSDLLRVRTMLRLSGQRRNGSEGGGLEELKPAGRVGVDVQKADDLAGHGGAHVGTHDDAESLVQGDDPGTHETGGDDDGGGGALDDGGHAHAQQKAGKGAVGDLFHGSFQRVGGAPLQSFAHDAHSVEKKRETSDHGNYGENVQFLTSLSEKWIKRKCYL